MVEKPGLDIITFNVPYEGDATQDDLYDDHEANVGEDDGGVADIFIYFLYCYNKVLDTASFVHQRMQFLFPLTHG
jgi:hypothetical protein